MFVRGGPGPAARVGLLPGAFNPPTIAHTALIEAARPHVDQVICVLPREFPHKKYEGASLEQRIAMLDTLAAAGLPFDIALTEGGLFIDIARECRDAFGRDLDVFFLCGRDAAERIIEWDYGHPHAVHRMLDEFRLLVADRGGRFHPPPALAHRIERIETSPNVDTISSTEVRRRMARGEPWQHLIPPPIRAVCRDIYAIL